MREIAQLLTESDLGEVSLEFGSGPKITLKRKPKPNFVGVAPPAPDQTATESDEIAVATETPATLNISSDGNAILVASPCVGVFHAAKEAVEVGSVVRPKQLVGMVESLKVPNEVYASTAGVIAQIWVSDGQGVEWGQPLFEIQPGEAPVQHSGG